MPELAQTINMLQRAVSYYAIEAFEQTQRAEIAEHQLRLQTDRIAELEAQLAPDIAAPVAEEDRDSDD